MCLQHGDSFFPAGAIALSGGVETLVEEGYIDSALKLQDFLFGQLSDRWNRFDRPVMVAAYRVADKPERLVLIDAQVEAQSLATDSRTGSRHAGRALLAVHVKLGTAYSADYQDKIIDTSGAGHYTVVQGLVWRGTGVSELAALAMSAYGFCVVVVGAALRLGVIGHIDAQQIFNATRNRIESLLTEDTVDLDHIGPFSPEQEIAVMRHETMACRMFAN